MKVQKKNIRKSYQALSSVFLWAVIYLTLSIIFRVILFLSMTSGENLGSGFLSLIMGIPYDICVLGFLQVPILLALAVLPERVRSHRLFDSIWKMLFLFSMFGLLFLFFVEFFFFEEFQSRFNYIAVDYLIYPHEVFVNIWQSYPVMWVVLTCFVLALAIVLPFFKQISLKSKELIPFLTRLKWVGAVAVVTGSLFFTLSLPSKGVAGSRILREITNNSLYTFFYSMRTASLEYPQFYRTLPADQVSNFKRNWWSKKNSEPGHPPYARTVRPRNVVYIIEESFGSEFSKKLGGRENLTPEFDALMEQGILFDHVFATGNRTIRGLEASLSSFPPLPGRSVIKRDGTENFATMAGLLKRIGYRTTFLYGGIGGFDNMAPFMTGNGFDTFTDQGDLDRVTFSTAWGACDEDIFNQALKEFESLAMTPDPFFGVILTVSNHKPYTYPEGRITEDPEEHQRENAVRYADYALGKFFKEARNLSFYKDTLFVVFGDHGARVYGSPDFPLPSYRVPLLFLGPDGARHGIVDHGLGSSMDISPTVLGMLGYDGPSPFFGRDLLAHDLEVTPFVLLQHNREVALYDGERLVSLGLPKTTKVFDVDQTNLSLAERPADDAISRELIQLCVSIYQTAYDAYVTKSYHLEGAGGDREKVTKNASAF